MPEESEAPNWIASPDSAYETLATGASSRPNASKETVAKTPERISSFSLFSEDTPTESRQTKDRIVLVQRTPSSKTENRDQNGSKRIPRTKTLNLESGSEDEDEARDDSASVPCRPDTTPLKTHRQTKMPSPKRKTIDDRMSDSSVKNEARRGAKPKLPIKPKSGIVAAFSSSSSEDEGAKTTKMKQMLKPPKYDGTTSLETFLAQFETCASHNQWSKSEELAFLRSSLQKEAGQVLWDYGAEAASTPKQLKKILQERFGGANQADKYRLEVRIRRRGRNEPLNSLYSDIRRLTALAFPHMDRSARESIACDYFIDALNEPSFALKVRERNPKDLDEAFRIATQIEIWVKDVDRIQNEKKEEKTKRARETKVSEATVDSTEDLRKQLAELQSQMKKLTEDIARCSVPASPSVMTPVPPPLPTRPKPANQPNTRPSFGYSGKCWGCGSRSHLLWSCPNTSDKGKERIKAKQQNKYEDSPKTCPLKQTADSRTNTCIPVGHKKRKLRALIDTGSDVSLVGSEIAKRCRWKVRPCALTSVLTANGQTMDIDGMVIEDLVVGDRRVPSKIYVTSDLTGFILGIDWLAKQNEINWDFGSQRMRFGRGSWITLLPEDEEAHCRRICVERDIILPPKQETEVPVRVVRGSRWAKPFLGMTENQQIPKLKHVYSSRSIIPPKFRDINIRVLNTDPERQLLQKGTALGIVEEAEALSSSEGHDLNTSESEATEAPKKTKKNEDPIEQLMASLPQELTEVQREDVRKLLKHYEPIFSKNEFDIGRTHLVEYRIDTQDHRPIRQPLRRHPFKHLDLIDAEVAKMQEHGIVEAAASPWASNVVLVRKKDGSVRLCIDYRRINSITYKDSYPLPLIDNCLTALSGASWFSTLDLRSGYYNIPIAEEDRDKSAFVTRSGCFRFTVMPFGMTCAPSVFQRLMDFVLCGLSYMTCLVYLDDIIVFGRTFDEQLLRLGEVFGRIQDAKLKLKPSKCSLMQRSVAFLGHVVSEAGVSMQPEKTEAIRTWPVPRSITEVRAFMGTCGYYRRFVRDFSDIAKPMFDLMKKGAEFVWTEACQEAFETLKTKLTSEPILALPKDEGMYILDTDASDFALGCVLSQVQDDTERVIAFGSRTLSRSELKYETTRKELLAIVNGLKQFRQYLLGRHFVIRTDHAALSWLRRTPEPMPQLARWLTFIEQFDYEVVHRDGRKHGNADGLSRRPPATPSVNAIEAIAERSRLDPQAKPFESNRRVETAEACNEVHARAIVPNSDGASNAEAPPTEEEADLLVRENTASLQSSDPVLGPIIRMRLASDLKPHLDEVLSESETTKKLWNEWERLEVFEGLIYRRKDGRPGENEVLQLLVPKQLVTEAIRESHEGMTGGHFGVKRTTDQVKRRFYWPSLKDDVIRFCQTCPKCNEYHRGKLKRQGPLRPVLAGAPNERYYIDTTGPHPKSDRGNVYILTCIDAFTKWAEAFAIRNKEAETIARVLVEQVFCRFGAPVSVLSDQGKEVDGNIMKHICELLGIDKLRTTPYKPSTNQVERLHRTINAVLGKTVANHQRDWDVRLPYAMAAYRASRHEATGYSPNMLTLGHEARAPVDIVYGASENDDAEVTYQGYVADVRDRMTTAYEEVRSTLRKAAERNKRYYDVRVRPNTYSVGDWVYYFNVRKYPRQQDKWKRKYSGPYLVIRVPSSVTVVLQKGPKAKPFTTHVDKVKRYSLTPPKSWLRADYDVDRTGVFQSNQTPEALWNNDENEVYEAEAQCDAEATVGNEDSSRGTDFVDQNEASYDADVIPNPRPKRTTKPPQRFDEFVRKTWVFERSY